jgi:hypothetical protein
MKRSTLALAVLLSVGVGTVGCAPGSPSSAPTTPVAEDPSPTPTPTEQAEPEAERIVVGGESIVVLASDGTELASYDYFQDTADLVDGFTELFGSAPVETPVEGDPHSPAGIELDWDGFAIRDDERAGSPPYTPNHLVSVTAAEVDGIRIETTAEFTVGTPLEEVRAEAPDSETEPYEGEDGVTQYNFQVDAVALDADDPACPEEGCTLSVRLLSNEEDAAITRIIAPTPNFGA